MTKIDEIEDLRSELRHCQLTPAERSSAESRLAELLQRRDDSGHKLDADLQGIEATGGSGSTGT